MKLTFAITFCFVLAIASRSLADDDSRMGITTDGTDITTRVADSGDSLFDFPISRALGIDIQDMLRPKSHGPSIYDLAVPPRD